MKHTQLMQTFLLNFIFLQSYCNNTFGASTWHAASNNVKKKENLDETGLEMVGCRHAVAQHAVNMYSGEMYGYAHYLQTISLKPKKVSYLWYDIICLYWPWLTKHDSEAVHSMKFALSVMHAKAHSWSCQVFYMYKVHICIYILRCF